MKDDHIINIIESAPLGSLSESEIMLVRVHVESCPSCRRAYQAAELSAVLIKERTAETIEPSPFFQTRVMAAWREQQVIEKVPAFWRLWKSAGALVSTLTVTTAALAAFSFLTPSSANLTSQETAVAASPYSAEAVVLDQNQGEEQLSYDQVLNTIYVNDDEAR